MFQDKRFDHIMNTFPSRFNNQNEEIPIGNNRKYHANVTATQAFLKIKHIDIKDFGNYTLIASNHFDEQKQLQLFLNVTG